jgi:pimeloyl-ACP methyl ester carboxylesterase
MDKALKFVSWGILSVFVLLVLAWLSLWRGDIPYNILERRYATSSSHYMDLPDGLHLQYRDEGDPSKPPLMLVHGFSASSADWDAWANQLGDAYRIIAPDLPGHGLTRAPKGYVSSPDDQARVLEEFRVALGLKHFILVGNSMGGGAAWRYAIAHSQALDALVLVDAAGWKDERKGASGQPLLFRLLANPVTRVLIKDLDASSLGKSGLEDAFYNKSLVTPELLRRYSDLSRAPGHRDIMIGTAPQDFLTAKRLAVIKTPTLIIFGKEDRLIPYTDGQKFNSAIKGSTLIIYPGVGHVPMEQIPEKSAADLRSWLEGLHLGSAPVATSSKKT